MQSLWNDDDARACGGDPLKLRVYTSRLLGREPDLVLHGGGNTSVKAPARDAFGDEVPALFVKGSGWDLRTIEAPGFAPVRLDALERMAQLDRMSDAEMVRLLRSQLLDPAAPNPSVEAILHGILAPAFVDHTHADAVVTLSNNPNGEAIVREVYGERVLVVPYVMPGFLLAQRVYEMTREVDLGALDAIILLNHGVFTFDDDARASYEKMIRVVGEAEDYLEEKGAATAPRKAAPTELSPDALLTIARARRAVSQQRGEPMVARFEGGEHAAGFASREDAVDLATRGPITPDHLIRTKPKAAVLAVDPDGAAEAVEAFAEGYRGYVERHLSGDQTALDPAPRWALLQGCGTLAFGRGVGEAGIVGDIVAHTLKAAQWGEALGGWQPLPEPDLFDMEYWELEQAKLAQAAPAREFQGKVALVSGAAAGIGRACAEALYDRGAAVVTLDLNPVISEIFDAPDRLGITCDVTDDEAVAQAIASIIERFGGLDILVSNAGIFTAGQYIEVLEETNWERSMKINLTSHQRLLKTCIPYLKAGIDAAVVFVGSRNFAAPGPGAASYSVAKAGLTQLARVASLELAGDGVRVNVVHPDAVFDTELWTQEALERSAQRYGMTVDEYKMKNLLKTEIKSRDVGEMVATVAGRVFLKTTGAQIPIDGGNDRVI